MKALYQVAINETLNLDTRYEAARIMQYKRRYPTPKKRKARDYKEEYKRRREMWGV